MDSNPRSRVRPVARAASRGVACVLLAVCAVSSACATAINGSMQRVAIASDPPGAQVYVNAVPSGVTPAFVDVSRRARDLAVRLEKDGYEPTVVALERSSSGWSWGNLLLAGVPFNDYGIGEWVGAVALYGVLGSLWDAAQGGAYKRPGLVRVKLAPVPQAGSAFPGTREGLLLPAPPGDRRLP